MPLSNSRKEMAEAVALDLASSFIRKKALGIVFLGALARGYFDDYSDIDMVVYKRRGVRLGWPREKEFKYRGFIIDLEVRNYERDLYRIWTLEERWVFSHAKIHFDPEGLVRDLLNLKVPLSQNERSNILRDETCKASWSIGDIDAWLYRGDIPSAHYAVTTAFKHLLRALAALNNVPPPPDKWLINVAFSLPLRPPQLSEIVREVMLCKEIDAEDLHRRRVAVEDLMEWLTFRCQSLCLEQL